MTKICKSIKKSLYLKIITLLFFGVLSIHCYIFINHLIEPYKETKKRFVLPKSFAQNVHRNDNTTFLLRPWKYQSNSKKYFVTFLVKSSIYYDNRRNLIRETWGSLDSIADYRVRIVFLIGKSDDKIDQDFIKKENKVFGDILQSDVPDLYNFLPEKVLSGFKFISTQKDIKTDYIVTTDDDCYIPIVQFVEYFKNRTKMNNIHCGFAFSELISPVRDEKSKYYISRETYSSDLFPPFCHGGMVVLSHNHLIKLYETSLITEKGDLILEDVYIYGILRYKYLNKTKEAEFKLVKSTEEVGGTFFPKKKLVYHLDNRDSLSKDMRKKWFKTLKELSKL